MWARRVFPLIALVLGVAALHADAQVDHLPSWNDGPAKAAIVRFVGG